MNEPQDPVSRQAIPWRRIFVEGGTIVVSILLAFAIDAGWEAHLERQEEQELLSSLVADFRVNRAAAEEILDLHAANFDTFVRFQELSPEELAALGELEVSQTIRSFASPFTFDPLRGTLDTLISSGKFGLIRNADLQRALVTYLNRLADSEEDIRYMANSAEIAWRGYVAHGGPWRHAGNLGDGTDSFLPALDAATLTAIRDDAELMGLIRLHIQAAQRYVGELESQLEAIEQVLALLGEPGPAR